MSYSEALEVLAAAHTMVGNHPYCILWYINSAEAYLDLDYPDLAAGAAYKALLLADAIQDTADEYHHWALYSIKLNAFDEFDDNQSVTEDETTRIEALVSEQYLPRM